MLTPQSQWRKSPPLCCHTCWSAGGEKRDKNAADDVFHPPHPKNIIIIIKPIFRIVFLPQLWPTFLCIGLNRTCQWKVWKPGTQMPSCRNNCVKNFIINHYLIFTLKTEQMFNNHQWTYNHKQNKLSLTLVLLDTFYRKFVKLLIIVKLDFFIQKTLAIVYSYPRPNSYVWHPRVQFCIKMHKNTCSCLNSSDTSRIDSVGLMRSFDIKPSAASWLKIMIFQCSCPLKFMWKIKSLQIKCGSKLI